MNTQGGEQRAFVALGSNLGPGEALIGAALRALAACAAMPGRARRAGLWRSAPVGCPSGAPDFLNTVMELDWRGTGAELLALCRAIEQALGRRRGLRNAPRTIDLDLLFVGAERVRTPELELPHPRLAQRRFVLEPLAELAPEWTLEDGRSVARAAAELRRKEPGGMERVE